MREMECQADANNPHNLCLCLTFLLHLCPFQICPVPVLKDHETSDPFWTCPRLYYRRQTVGPTHRSDSPNRTWHLTSFRAMRRMTMALKRKMSCSTPGTRLLSRRRIPCIGSIELPAFIIRPSLACGADGSSRNRGNHPSLNAFKSQDLLIS